MNLPCPPRSRPRMHPHPSLPLTRLLAAMGLATLSTLSPTVFAQAAYGISLVPSGTSTPVEIRFSEVSANPSALMTKDLNIMSLVLERHLDRTLGPRGRQVRMGIPLLLPGTTPRVQGTYLEGFGALFSIQVDIPLLPPPAESTPTAETGRPGSEWESARRALAGADDPGAGLPWPAAAPSAVPYDSSRVEDLRRGLMKVLKEAANMRALTADEWVALVVVGPGSRGPATTTIGVSSRYQASSHGSAYGEVSGPAGGGAFASGGYGGGGGLVGSGAAGGLGAAPSLPVNRSSMTSFQVSFGDDGIRPANDEQTILALRVRKSDIDAFAQGTLDDEGFAQRATCNIYSTPTR